MNQDLEESVPESPKKTKSFPWWMILLFLILCAGAFFRVTGINWGAAYHMHPDERFLTMVVSAISPVTSTGEYFNTDISTLNPANRGYTFYVYGTLPLFIVRYVAEWVQQSGYGDIFLVGRYLSALFDLLTIALAFLIADRLFHKAAINLLAAAFYAAAVLPIQLSHYFTVDSFANFFTILSIYFAVWIMTSPFPWDHEEAVERIPNWLLHHWQGIFGYIFFGFAFGMAMASKVSAVFVVLLLPVAIFVQLRQTKNKISYQKYLLIFRNLVIAGLISFLVFRVLQPYAFAGPGFINIRISENWVNSLRDLAAQSNGNSDAPPALQWANRPITFSWENMVKWGLGLPLGLLAWVGFLWMAWKIFVKRDWRPYLLIWLWTALSFVYQSLQFSRTMRYQIHIYPTLAIIAATFLYALWKQSGKFELPINRIIAKTLSWIFGVGVVVSTFTWAFAFTQIYIDPFTREAASEWMYQNVPTIINLDISSDDGLFVQHIPYGYGDQIRSEKPLKFVFKPHYEAPIFTVQIDHVLAVPTMDVEQTLLVEIRENIPDGEVLLSGQINQNFNNSSDPRGTKYQIPIESTQSLSPEKEYLLLLQTVEPNVSLQVMGAISVGYVVDEGNEYQYLPEVMNTLSAGEVYQKTFVPLNEGNLKDIYFPHVLDYEATDALKRLSVQVIDQSDENKVLLNISTENLFHAQTDYRGDGLVLTVEDTVRLEKDHTYLLEIKNESDNGSLAFFGSKKADESSWDDVIPLNMYGYSAFDYYDGLYRTDLNFEMYWDDNEEKRDRFYENLDQADYFSITSSRQWGTTVRVPERYPLTIEFYRAMLGCPEEEDILWCYRVAQPGMFQSKLGFELIEVFQSDPHIGDLISFNTQFAEEAFTVYDHPKVLIFKKTDAYQPALSRQIFESVDLSKVIHLLPKEVGKKNADTEPVDTGLKLSLMLPEETWQAQQETGTWSEIFNPDVLYNRYPALAVPVWYLSILLMSWIIFPFVHLAFPNFRFRGYPFAKLISMLLLALGSWWLSSNGFHYTKTTIGMVLLGLIECNIVIFLLRRKVILNDIRTNWKNYLMLEGITLVFFVFFLLVRIGNPDLWHPAKGGEKPMDFSYFNAILKTDSFPAYDPWFAGGYINYYYYGFVVVGTLVKYLGITPSVAYNLILPSLYSMGAIGAFSIGWNLAEEGQENTKIGSKWNLLAGLFASIMAMLIGNLGTIRMIWHGFIRIAGGTLPLDDANIFEKIFWTISGFIKFIGGEGLGYGYGNWYWDPSRAFPGEPITEFPMFTYLYADLHAHLISIPITILALGIVIHLLLSTIRKELSWSEIIAASLLGGVVFGALRPTNTWDVPLYIILISLAYLYVGFVQPLIDYLRQHTRWNWRLTLKTGFGYLLLLVGIVILYEPFSRWYGAGYTKFVPFTGQTTPFWSYITHWGFFLFIYIFWLIWESRDWMDKTPLSVLQGFLKQKEFIFIVIGFVVLGWIGLTAWLLSKDIAISWFVLLLLVWAAILLLRNSLPLQKKAVLFLFSTGLFITLFVELMALEGDLGRMNTVFKFYLQVWTIMSICSAVILVWLLPAFRAAWSGWQKNVWNGIFAVLTISVLLFTLFATSGKIKDRMSMNAPHSIDGLAYMEVATHEDYDVRMDLSEDYHAILWMQQNIVGTPVIVEGHATEYRWGSRFTINTGLPGVLGWNWHQRQQRAVLANNEVQEREELINQFYDSADITQALAFIEKYNVKYIVFGQLESGVYSALGLSKFPTYEGIYWDVVYDQGHTIIYKVIE